MVKLVVSDQQAELILSARERVSLCDGQGRFLGVLSTVDTPERIAEMQQRAKLLEPTYPTSEVLAYIDGLKSQ